MEILSIGTEFYICEYKNIKLAIIIKSFLNGERIIGYIFGGNNTTSIFRDDDLGQAFNKMVLESTERDYIDGTL